MGWLGTAGLGTPSGLPLSKKSAGRPCGRRIELSGVLLGRDPKQPGLFANQKTSRDIVRDEKNLNTFGFFTPLHKRTEKIREKRVTILVREHEGQRAEAYATILPSAKLGLPTTADQDKFYAFQKLLDHTRRRNGSISNPVAFTSAELLKLLKRKKSGQSYREISDWLERMTLTGIRSKGSSGWRAVRVMRGIPSPFSREPSP